MKKIIITLVIFMFITIGCSLKTIKEEKSTPIPKSEGIPLMEFDKYKDFFIDNVKSLTIIRYTEGGAVDETIDDKSEIIARYNALSRYKVYDETNRACEDNTTIYRFNMQNGTTTSFEFECEWLVLGKKRYNVEREK